MSAAVAFLFLLLGVLLLQRAARYAVKCDLSITPALSALFRQDAWIFGVSGVLAIGLGVWVLL